MKVQRAVVIGSAILLLTLIGAAVAEGNPSRTQEQRIAKLEQSNAAIQNQLEWAQGELFTRTDANASEVNNNAYRSNRNWKEIDSLLR